MVYLSIVPAKDQRPKPKNSSKLPQNTPHQKQFPGPDHTFSFAVWLAHSFTLHAMRTVTTVCVMKSQLLNINKTRRWTAHDLTRHFASTWHLRAVLNPSRHPELGATGRFIHWWLFHKTSELNQHMTGPAPFGWVFSLVEELTARQITLYLPDLSITCTSAGKQNSIKTGP